MRHKAHSIEQTPTALPTQFAPGQIVEHTVLDIRCVIFDVDPVFMLSDEWYERCAAWHPNQEQPWYHVLVDNGVQCAYVAQEELLLSANHTQINHPSLGEYFNGFDGLRYSQR